MKLTPLHLIRQFFFGFFAIGAIVSLLHSLDITFSYIAKLHNSLMLRWPPDLWRIALSWIIFALCFIGSVYTNGTLKRKNDAGK